MSSSTSALDIDNSKLVIFCDNYETKDNQERLSQSVDTNSSDLARRKQILFPSQLMHMSFPSSRRLDQVFCGNEMAKDERCNSFRTWPIKLDCQSSSFHRRCNDFEVQEADSIPTIERYFDALEGPELETLRVSEEMLLPDDKTWPFLLRFPITSFGVCLGASSQAMLWKAIASSPSLSFLNVSRDVNMTLWCIALAILVLVGAIYSLKIIIYFEAVRREYYHPIRINFFFAPWIACLFMAIAVPPHIAMRIPSPLWYVLMAPILCLELKIYGQWMSGGERRLSKVANPTNNLAVVGNFVGALLGASMGLKEGPLFFFAVGLAHYIVLFVTLYQRLPTNETLPKELHPVFFLFIAPPSVVCMSWSQITGSFGVGSKLAYFIAMFLYVSLVVRINFFRGFRFSLAWWAYTFPMVSAAIATIRYTTEVNNVVTKSFSITLSVISTLIVSALLILTVFNAFVLHRLFPNDIAIAITYERSKVRKDDLHHKTTKSYEKDIEACSTER